MEDGIADAVLAEREIYVIEQHMMDRRKFLPFVTVGNCMIRCTLYPFNLVKTRLQSQTGKNMYRGTFHAIGSIWKHEGLQGLYRGVGINIPQILPSVLYIMTYEQARNEMRKFPSMNHNLTKAVVGGAMASLVSQTMSVPLDIITQHIMLVGRQKKPAQTSGTYRSLEEIHVPEEVRRRHLGTVRYIVSHLYKNHGVQGFYKGYIMSLCFFVPNSASWWTFYELYKEMLFKSNLLPDTLPRLVLYACIAGPMAGVTSTIITNPLDVLRIRIQVKHSSLGESLRVLYKEDGWMWLFKGWSARLVHSVLFSLLVIPVYEGIKIASLDEKYKHAVS